MPFMIMMVSGGKMANKVTPKEQLEKIANENNVDLKAEEFAKLLDEKDDLKWCREEFCYPKNKTLPPIDLSLVDGEKECIYFCNNSLGLMPKRVEDNVKEELKKWAEMGVYGHTHGEYPWMKIEDFAVKPSARLVGANADEIAIMNSLTVNLHILMIPFYRPTPERHRILLEEKAFPSDHYAVESQIRFHGYDPKEAMILAKRREGEEIWRTEDIIALIEKEGDSIALILFSGVHYYTAQFFDIKAITQAGHKKETMCDFCDLDHLARDFFGSPGKSKATYHLNHTTATLAMQGTRSMSSADFKYCYGCVVGFDLAHAVGNVPMHLHDWNVDFAAWCTYKYLNSGAGGLSGIYVNEKHTEDASLPRLCGWWGHELKTRFQMDNNMKLATGASGFQISNANFMSSISLITSLEIFDRVGMDKLREKSLLLTGYLELLINETYGKKDDAESKDKLRERDFYTEIVTPTNPDQRGCQLSVKFSIPITKVKSELDKRGVVCDKREPDVLRVAPAPLVNKFHDVWRFIQVLGEAARASMS